MNERKWSGTLVAGIILALLMIVFALQNADPVTVNLIIWKIDLPLALILVGTFAIGVLSAMLGMVSSYYGRRKLINQYKKRIKELEASQVVIADPASIKPAGNPE